MEPRGGLRILLGACCLFLATADLILLEPTAYQSDYQIIRTRRQAPSLNVHSIPKTSFSCSDKKLGEYYADPETRCQVYHICLASGGGRLTPMSFVCPNGTIFSQASRVCNTYEKVYCQIAEQFYETLHGDLNQHRVDYGNPNDYANLRLPNVPKVPPQNNIDENGGDEDYYEEPPSRPTTTTQAPRRNRPSNNRANSRPAARPVPTTTIPPPPPPPPSPAPVVPQGFRRQSFSRPLPQTTTTPEPEEPETDPPVRPNVVRRPVFRNTPVRANIPVQPEEPVETETPTPASPPSRVVGPGGRLRGVVRPALPTPSEDDNTPPSPPAPVLRQPVLRQPASANPDRSSGSPSDRLPPGLRGVARPVAFAEAIETAAPGTELPPRSIGNSFRGPALSSDRLPPGLRGVARPVAFAEAIETAVPATELPPRSIGTNLRSPALPGEHFLPPGLRGVARPVAFAEAINREVPATELPPRSVNTILRSPSLPVDRLPPGLRAVARPAAFTEATDSELPVDEQAPRPPRPSRIRLIGIQRSSTPAPTTTLPPTTLPPTTTPKEEPSTATNGYDYDYVYDYDIKPQHSESTRTKREADKEYRVSRYPPVVDTSRTPILTQFTCQGKLSGFVYADVQTDCEMFHVCVPLVKGKMFDYRLFCANNTAFNQRLGICEEKENFKCAMSEKFYRHDKMGSFQAGQKPSYDKFRLPRQVEEELKEKPYYPQTSFSCSGKTVGGYYADPDTNCQMFHICAPGLGGHTSDLKFLCSNGTSFNQKTLVCDQEGMVQCGRSEEYYINNHTFLLEQEKRRNEEEKVPIRDVNFEFLRKEKSDKLSDVEPEKRRIEEDKVPIRDVDFDFLRKEKSDKLSDV